MANEIYYIGANDEHGVNPPTPGKRTPYIAELGRQIYENEFNRAAKNYFLAGCLRNGFSVYDVKPELFDVSISQRVRRINAQNLTLLVTFAYNAYGESFNEISGVEVFYSPTNAKVSQSRALSEKIYQNLIEGTTQNGRGVKTLDVGVLSSVNCASSLVEAGFMTNLREARLMINPLFQEEVGEETCLGVCDFLGVQYVPRNNLQNYPLLKTGANNNFVFLLQFLLNLQPDTNLAIDGIFGNQTYSAVQKFQHKNGLMVDGIVGTNTWRTILNLPPYPVLKKGASGDYVTFMQQLLESNLFSVGGIDGIFGPSTERAVKAFQQAKDLTVDGIVGTNTWKALSTLP